MLHGKKIFIVEDNAMNRAVYTIMLKKEGCIIEFDRWGRDAINKLGKDQYDLIILDLMLPIGNSGFNVFLEIKQLEQYKDVPIVAVSASEPSASISKSKELGFSGFIAKPIDKDLFKTQLVQLLQGEAVWYEGSRL